VGLRAFFILTMVVGGIIYAFKRPYFGLVLFAGMTYIRPERLSYGDLASFHLFLVVSLCGLLAYFLQKSRLPVIQDHSKVLYALLALALLQMFFSPFAAVNVSLSWEYAFIFFKIAIFCLLMTKLLTSEDKIKWFIIANLVGVVFIGLWGFEQHFRGNVRLEKIAGGNYNESNSVGALFAQFVPIFLSLVFIIKKKYRLLPLAIVGVLSADVIFTQSRAALLGLIVGLTVFWVVISIRLKVVTALIALSFFPLMKEAVFSTEGYEDRIESTVEGEDRGADRISIWIAGIHILKDHPITGVGQQNFQYLAKEYCVKLGLEHDFKARGDAHNQYLLTAAETGILGILAYLLAFYFHFSDIHRLKKAWRSDDRYGHYVHLLRGIQAGTISFMVSMMFHTHPIEEHLYWFLMVPGLMLNVYEDQKKADGPMAA